MNNAQPHIINLPKILDKRGNLSFFENDTHLPFTIRRVHWIYDVPGGEQRGGLAYKKTEEFIVAMSGSFDVIVDDGKTKQSFTLNRSYYGLYIPAGTWRTIINYSTNSVALIAASTFYDATDAIRDYSSFQAWAMLNSERGLFDNTNLNNSANLLSIKQQFVTKNFISDCKLINLDRHHSDRKGDISVVENGTTVPFDIKRVYYLYDVPGGETRGGHAHKHLSQLLMAVSGSFTVNLYDGTKKSSITLNRPYQGLLIKPGIWRDLDNFSSCSVCLVLASEKYDEHDYIRDFNEFIQYRRQ